MEKFKWLLQQSLIFFIRVYQYSLARLLGPCCRFKPHCSDYAITALIQWGLCQGLWLIILRLLRCHPWRTGGDDPVPLKKERFG